MARIKGAIMTRKRRNKVLKLAKGYYGSKSNLFKTAKQAVMKSGTMHTSAESRRSVTSAVFGSPVSPLPAR